MSIGAIVATTTTLATAVTRRAFTVRLTSATGVVRGTKLWVNREQMKVQSIAGRLATVRRASAGLLSAHDAGDTVTIANETPTVQHFYTSDPDIGAAAVRGVGQARVLPWINTKTGVMWVCSEAGEWHPDGETPFDELTLTGLLQIGTEFNRTVYIDPVAGTMAIGQTGNTVAVLSLNRAVDDPLIQFGLNVLTTWAVSGVEGTGARVAMHLAAGVIKADGAGFVIEGTTLGAGAGYSDTYYSGLVRGQHAAGFAFTRTFAIETSKDGTLWVGPDKNGTTALDGLVFREDSTVNLYPAGANHLKTDDAFDAASYKVGGVAGATGSGSNVTAVFGIVTAIN